MKALHLIPFKDELKTNGPGARYVRLSSTEFHRISPATIRKLTRVDGSAAAASHWAPISPRTNGRREGYFARLTTWPDGTKSLPSDLYGAPPLG